MSEWKSGSRPKISVRNLQRKIAVERDALESFAHDALTLCLSEKSACLTSLSEISVLLVSERKMSELHRRFMHISGPTDVITFQHGEICISVETAQRQARMYRTSLVHELRLYLVHGLLHLHGFEDRDPVARRRMQALQEKIMRRAMRS